MTQSDIRLPRLLVIDDEKGMREGVRRIFGAEGFEVATAEAGLAGIELGGEWDFDVALVDLKMPDCDGIEVLRRLREKRPDAEYIMMTAYAGLDTAMEATRVGAYTYIPKPFTPDQILFEVKRAFEKRRLTLEARELRAEQERRLLEIHLEQSRLRTIINAISDAVFVTNREEQIVLANPRTRALFQLPASIGAGTPVTAALPAEVVEHIRDSAGKIESGVEMASREWEMRPDRELVLSMKTVPLRDADGAAIGYVTTLQDVTDLKKLDFQKSQFVSMVAHELKAPLAAISGYIDTMQGKLLGADIAAYATMLNRSGERLRSLIDLINDLLNISRMDLGTVRREIVDVSIGETVQTAAEFLRQEIEKRGLSFTSRTPVDLPPVDADRDELQRVFTNLLSNAIKYNREGGSIDVDARREGDSVSISISDSGIGMKEEEVQQLFRQFYRARNEKTRSIPGTGLGLSIVRQIVESYHGTVSVESAFGKGTKFQIRLPIHYVEK
jgi:two-component system, OmpR family, phosphate regulon sensor histidine kinase PhoR